MTTTDVFEFEGEEVTDFTVQIPSTKLETSKAYPRGTILNMNVSLRVRAVRIEEDRQGNMIRHHMLAVEDAVVRKATTPADRRAAMEAEEAAEAAQQEPVIQEEPGVEDVQADQPATETLHNEAADDVVDAEVVEETDFSDVEARDQAQAETVKGTDDAHQYAEAGF